MLLWEAEELQPSGKGPQVTWAAGEDSLFLIELRMDGAGEVGEGYKETRGTSEDVTSCLPLSSGELNFRSVSMSALFLPSLPSPTLTVFSLGWIWFLPLDFGVESMAVFTGQQQLVVPEIPASICGIRIGSESGPYLAVIIMMYTVGRLRPGHGYSMGRACIVTNRWISICGDRGGGF